MRAPGTPTATPSAAAGGKPMPASVRSSAGTAA